MHHSSDNHTQRNAYLKHVSTRYELLTLPFSLATHGFPLQDVFQSLQLRSDPLSAEGLAPGQPSSQERASGHQETLQLGQGSPPGEAQHARDFQASASNTIVVSSGVEALAQSPTRRMIILGGPGTGKTTLLKHADRRAGANRLATIPLRRSPSSSRYPTWRVRDDTRNTTCLGWCANWVWRRPGQESCGRPSARPGVPLPR